MSELFLFCNIKKPSWKAEVVGFRLRPQNVPVFKIAVIGNLIENSVHTVFCENVFH